MDFIDQWIAELSAHNFEGRCRWLYRDSVGLATFGVGNMVPSAAADFQYLWKLQNGQPATSDQVAADFARVMALPADKLPHVYFCPASLLVDDSYITALLRNRGLGFAAQLRKMLWAFDSFHVDAKIALLDMAFNLGIGRPVTGDDRATGLHEYESLIHNLLSSPPNYAAASNCCARNTSEPSFTARNQWTREKFAMAAQEIA
jgi:hypothetical protein